MLSPDHVLGIREIFEFSLQDIPRSLCCRSAMVSAAASALAAVGFFSSRGKCAGGTQEPKKDSRAIGQKQVYAWRQMLAAQPTNEDSLAEEGCVNLG